MSHVAKPPGCLPECEWLTLAERHPDETKPPELEDYSWTEVAIGVCADGCPNRAADIARGLELAEIHGWT